MPTKFSSEYKAFGYIFALLVTLCTLPVTAWHYWRTLEGFALLGIGGLALADCVLWFASHWAGKVQSGNLKAVTLGVKFSLAAVMVCIAALCIVLMRQEKDVVNIAQLEQQNRLAEIEARAKAATTLTQSGNRTAAREIVKTSAAESISSIATQSRQQMETRVPGWLVTWGIYILPPLSALLGALILSIAATLTASREDAAGGSLFRTEDDEPVVPFFQSATSSRPLPAARKVLQGSASGKLQPSSSLPAGLPSLPEVQFEKHSKGGFEVWKSDESAKRGKRYVCYVGKKRMAEGPEAIASFIRERMA